MTNILDKTVLDTTDIMDPGNSVCLQEELLLQKDKLKNHESLHRM